ncbi:MAG: hypothetical protein LBF59_03490 [Prevotellaceae bacterium]|jgi:hypothetical protein|nr:hypothetical protein [Prevotellaceae bacterium]
MKKIGLVLLIASICFVSCSERYEEKRGPVFEGTWTLVESYVDTVRVISHRAKFITARKFEGEDLLLFYSGGRYDSSFFFRLQNNVLFVRRVLDSVDVLHSYYLTDSDGNEILDDEGNKILKIDTLREAWKPLDPATGYSPERYYGTCSFDEGAILKLTINRYLVDEAGEPTDKLYGRDIYERPVEIE